METFLLLCDISQFHRLRISKSARVTMESCHSCCLDREAVGALLGKIMQVLASVSFQLCIPPIPDLLVRILQGSMSQTALRQLAAEKEITH